jgi:hypothetical protein
MKKDILLRLSKFKKLINELEDSINDESENVSAPAMNIAGGVILMCEILSQELAQLKSGQSLAEKIKCKFTGLH